MLKVLSRLVDSTVTATDGPIGRVKEAFFDDQSWAIRYLVVHAGTWLKVRDVLISPYAVRSGAPDDANIDIALTREQVRKSPAIDTHQPVSRRHEREYLGYYAYPEYWNGGGLWASGAFPLLLPDAGAADLSQARAPIPDSDTRDADFHLRSSASVTGYDIQASDDSIGHVADFVFDDQSWAIRYLLVDTRNWWPGGRKVLVATHWIDRIEWSSKKVFVALTREKVMNGAQYEEGRPITREFEARLHADHGREKYWD